jgi:hypothetical protein
MTTLKGRTLITLGWQQWAILVVVLVALLLLSGALY